MTVNCGVQTSLLGPGLDVRGDGGYVILPSSGSGYTWDPLLNFDTVLDGRLRRSGYGRPSLRAQLIAAPSEAGRGAGALRRGGNRKRMQSHTSMPARVCRKRR